MRHLACVQSEPRTVPSSFTFCIGFAKIETQSKVLSNQTWIVYTTFGKCPIPTCWQIFLRLPQVTQLSTFRARFDPQSIQWPGDLRQGNDIIDKKWWFPKGISYSRVAFSGSMLNFGGVYNLRVVQTFLSWWLNQPISQIGSFPQVVVKNKKYLKPPPR